MWPTALKRTQVFMYSAQFKRNSGFVLRFLRKFPVSNFMGIRSVGAALCEILSASLITVTNCTNILYVGSKWPLRTGLRTVTSHAPLGPRGVQPCRNHERHREEKWECLLSSLQKGVFKLRSVTEICQKRILRILWRKNLMITVHRATLYQVHGWWYGEQISHTEWKESGCLLVNAFSTQGLWIECQYGLPLPRRSVYSSILLD